MYHIHCLAPVITLTCGVGRGAVPCEVVGQLQLGQLNARVHVQRHGVVPLEHQVVRRVRYWSEKIIISESWFYTLKGFPDCGETRQG